MSDKGRVTRVEPRAIRKKATQDEYAHNMTLIYTGMLLARHGLIRDAGILGRDRDKFLELLEKVERGFEGRCPYVLGNLPAREVDKKTEERLDWKYPHAKLPFDVGEEAHGSYGFVASWLGVPLTKNDIVDMAKAFWDKDIDPNLPQKWYERGKITRVDKGKGQKGATYDGGSVRTYLGELYGEPTNPRPDQEPWTMPISFPKSELEQFLKRTGMVPDETEDL